MSVYAPIVGHVWATLESYGIDPREVIDKAMYRPEDPTLTSRRVPFGDYEAMITRAVSRVGDPAVGVRSAQCFHPSYLGALGHAWMASHDLRSAMHRAARLRRMFNEQIQLDIEETPDRVRLVYRMLEPVRAADIVGDAHVANLLQLGRIHFGTHLMPVDVTLTRKEPDDPSPWIEHFGPVVRVGQPEHSFTLSAKDADAPLTGSNPELDASVQVSEAGTITLPQVGEISAIGRNQSERTDHADGLAHGSRRSRDWGRAAADVWRRSG